MLSKLLYYPQFVLSFCVLRRDVPFILGLVLCDRCNLACRHCRVAMLLLSSDGTSLSTL
jgi:hypothetical protein